jgi:hypothetical protein
VIKYIGFAGAKGGGKDTAAGMLEESARRMGLDLGTASFAGPLKELCADIFAKAYDVPPSAFYGSQADKALLLTEYGLNVSGRGILQHLGTEGLRYLASDIHVRLAFADLPEGPDGYMFTDVRFPDEGFAIRARRGVLVRTTRGRNDDPHPSERALDGFECDYVLDNADWTLDELRARVEDLARVLFRT